MLFFFLIISIIFSGYAILSFVETSNILEKIGLAFLVGLLVETLAMFTINLLGMKLSVLVLFLIPAILIVVSLKFVRGRIYSDFVRMKKFWSKFDFKEYNLLWLFLLGIVLFLLYASLRKSLFWPTFNIDGIHSYAVTGKLIANEGTFLNKFARSNLYIGMLVYPLLHTCAFSLPYFCGLSTVKIMVSLFYMSFALVSYNLMFRFTQNRLCSIIFLLLLVATPEMYAFSSLTSSNIPLAIYTSLSILYSFDYIKNKKNSSFLLLILMICGSCWIRNESIMFLFAIFIVIFFSFLRTKENKKKMFFFIFPFLIFLVWQFVSSYALEGVPIRKTIISNLVNFDFNFLFLGYKAMLETFFSLGFYGIVFPLFVISIILNIKKNSSYDIYFLSLFFLTLFFYSTFFYIPFIGCDLSGYLDVIRNSSYKRAIFIYVPLALFYVFNSYYVLKFFTFVEHKLSFNNLK